MNKLVSDILEHIRMISGNNLIAGSVNYFLENNDMTADAIIEMAKQLQDQIKDNPKMMQEVLSADNYEFFSTCDLMPILNKVA